MLVELQSLIARFAAKDAEIALDGEHDRLIVDASDSDIDDGDIAVLLGFENLVDLNLAGSKVSNGAMEHIVTFSRLEYLDLGRTQCDEACLVYLLKLRELKGIGLSEMKLSAKALQLAQLKPLDVLYLADTSVPKYVVREIIQLTNVTFLDLSGNRFQADDFLDLDLLKDDCRTVSLQLGERYRVTIARPRNVRTSLG